jgi:hypothetical protein
VTVLTPAITARLFAIRSSASNCPLALKSIQASSNPASLAFTVTVAVSPAMIVAGRTTPSSSSPLASVSSPSASGLG